MISSRCLPYLGAELVARTLRDVGLLESKALPNVRSLWRGDILVMAPIFFRRRRVHDIRDLVIAAVEAAVLMQQYRLFISIACWNHFMFPASNLNF